MEEAHGVVTRCIEGAQRNVDGYRMVIRFAEGTQGRIEWLLSHRGAHAVVTRCTEDVQRMHRVHAVGTGRMHQGCVEDV